ncbi:MAG: hypothetical protein IJC83_01605 [Oscillospiraceae bacterium]|nr:hypothetical protein [Oscillospiraceae bacterium]
MQNEVLASIIAVVIMVSTILFVFSIAGYILKAVGLYKLAEKHKIKNSSMAFFPVANNYLLGKITEQIKAYDKKVSKIAGWLAVFSTISFVLGVISIVLTALPANEYMSTGVTADLLWLPPVFSYIAGPASIILTILCRVAGYSIFKYHTNHATALTIFSFVPFLFPIFLFAIRNSEKEKANAK